MRVAICSDLHLEFGDIILKNTDNAEVLILSGDILIAKDLYDTRTQRFYDFIQRCSTEFPHVVVIAGNHEFYHGNWKASIQDLRDQYSKFPNVYFLEQDMKVINDVTFIGATLWTDCNKGDPMTLHALGGMMNDFRIIENDEKGYTKLRPENTMHRHQQTVGYLKSVLVDRKDSKVVVVGHHAPSLQSIHEKYRNPASNLLNGGYASDLSEFILDHPQIVLWTHGHTHDPFDYMIGDTRVVCNPRGYVGHDARAEVFELKFLDI